MNKLIFSLLFSVSLSACASPGRNSLFTSELRVPQSAPANLGTVTIEDPSKYSQVFVISDVHGMYEALLRLLKAGKVIDNQNQWVAGNAFLIVTGDSIDKGPQSLEVLNLWIQLQSQAAAAGGGFVHVLGNHEAEFLADPQDDKKAADLIAELKAKKVPISDLTSTTTPRGLFLHSEALAMRMGRWLFCHSGFYPDMNWGDFSRQAKDVLNAQDYGNEFLIGDDSILEAKDWEKDKTTRDAVVDRIDKLGLFGIVFGHQPGAFGIQGRSAAKKDGRLIKIDNGMAPEAGAHSGSLLVFTKPAEMNQMAYPKIKVIFPDGTQQDLIPE